MAIVGRPLLASRGLRWRSVARDSAAALDGRGIAMTVEREGLESRVNIGPYANHVIPISGAFTFTAWHKGAVRDSLDGVAEWLTRDGARWRLALGHVPTPAVPHHPRLVGVILGLHFHGNTAVAAPLGAVISGVRRRAFGDVG